MTLNRLAEFLGMDKAQLSRALSNLVGRKFVARGANPQNNREVLLELTSAGLQVHETMLQAGMDLNASFLANLSSEQVSELDRVLEELTGRAIQMLRDEQLRDNEARLLAR